MTDVIIYHNPECGTSRNVLAMIRNSGVEPHIIEYLNMPAMTRLLLTELFVRAGLTLARSCARRVRPTTSSASEIRRFPTKHSRCDRGPSNPDEPPLVVTPKGVRLCRPSEAVLDLLPPQRGPFIKEDGERVIDDRGRRSATA